MKKCKKHHKDRGFVLINVKSMDRINNISNINAYFAI